MTLPPSTGRENIPRATALRRDDMLLFEVRKSSSSSIRSPPDNMGMEPRPFDATEEKEKKRKKWDHPSEGIFALIVYNLGTIQFARGFFLQLKYSIGACAIVLSLLFLLVIFPVMFLEMALGQFHSRGPGHIYTNMAPLFHGLGIGVLFVQTNMAVLFGAFQATYFFYLFSAFKYEWARCDSVWNSNKCLSMLERRDCVDSDPENRWWFTRKCYTNNTVDSFYSHIDNCFNAKWPDPSARTWDCEIKFNFDFNKYSAAKILLGNSLKSYSVAKKTKAMNTTTCFTRVSTTPGAQNKCIFGIFNVDTCGEGKYGSLMGKLSDIPANRSSYIDFRWATRTDRVKRRMAIKTFMEISDTKLFSNIIRRYCEATRSIHKEKGTGQLECLKKVVSGGFTFSADEFFYRYLSGAHTDYLEGFDWPLPLCLVLSWLIVGFCLHAGTRFMGKFSYVAVVFAFLMFAVLFFLSFFIDERDTGRDVLYKDAIVVVVAQFCFTFMAWYCFHAIVSYLCKVLNMDIWELAKYGHIGVVSHHITQMALSDLDGGQVISAFYWLLNSTLAIPSLVFYVATIITYLIDKYAWARKRRLMVITVTCLVLCFLGIPCVSRAGAIWISLWLISTWLLLIFFCCLVEISLILVVYGVNELMQDISMMMGLRRASWNGLANFHLGNFVWFSPARYICNVLFFTTVPVGISFILAANIYKIAGIDKRRDVLTYLFLYCVGAGAFPIIFIASILYQCFYHERSCRKCMQPMPAMGPALNINRIPPRYQLLVAKPEAERTDDSDLHPFNPNDPDQNANPPSCLTSSSNSIVDPKDDIPMPSTESSSTTPSWKKKRAQLS